jgi:hypothetical protein
VPLFKSTTDKLLSNNATPTAIKRQAANINQTSVRDLDMMGTPF